ncbi:MAG: Crp/Fnr family transcriptional regulator [Dehalococcoidia bacterium]
MVSAEILKGFQLFEGLDESELVEVARLCRERSYEQGSIIFTAGGSATDIYLLKDGEVNIQVELVIYDLEARATVYTVRKGETFSWSALVPPHKLTASARCQQKTEVLTIDGKKLMYTFEKNNHIGCVVMRNLSKVISSRLAATMVALRHQIQRASASKL